MVSCFKRVVSFSLLAFTLSCGQDGVAPLIGGSTAPKTGIVSTWAGTPTTHGKVQGQRLSAQFFGQGGITSDGKYLYICDTWNDLILRANISSGVIDILAGSTYGGTDGTGTSAQLANPYAITLHKGKLYVFELVDNNGVPTPRLRVVDPVTKAVTLGTTSTGTAGLYGFASDGTNLYIANGSKISKVNTTTFALTDFATGFASVNGLTYGGGYLWASDSNNGVIYRVNLSNGTKTLVGGSVGLAGNTDGPATTTALFASPNNLLYLNGVLYIYDLYQVRALYIASATVETLAGQYGVLGFADGTGTAVKFNAGYGAMATDGKSLFISDEQNHVIRKID